METLINSDPVLSHLKIIKVEKVQLYFNFSTNPLYFFYCMLRKIKIAKSYCEKYFFFLHLIDEQLRMEEEGQKLCGGLDRKY